MRTFLTALIALALLSTTPARAAELTRPQLIAVYFYADWCPNCRILTPKWEAARAKGRFDSKDILMVKFNMTDKPSIHQTIMLAQAMDLGPYLQAQGSATGYVALIDAVTKRELTRFDRDTPEDAMIAMVDRSLNDRNLSPAVVTPQPAAAPAP